MATAEETLAEATVYQVRGTESEPVWRIELPELNTTIDIPAGTSEDAIADSAVIDTITDRMAE